MAPGESALSASRALEANACVSLADGVLVWKFGETTITTSIHFGCLLSLSIYFSSPHDTILMINAPRWRSLKRVRQAMSEEARQQAQAEGLTLRVAENGTSYIGVNHHPGKTKPYAARVRRGGNRVSLGSFTTAEEAALCVARSPEGREAAERAAAAPPPAPPLTSEEARQQAQAEGLALLVADNETGYFCVHHKPARPKPFVARVWRGGKHVNLVSFATAEEAALCVARSPEGRVAEAEAAGRSAAAPPLTSEEARQQAQAEELTLLVAENKTGYFGVYLAYPGRPKPYQAQVTRGGKSVTLGSFVTAEEAALCVARSPEGQAAAAEAAGRAAAAPPLTSEEARQQAQAEELTLLVAENKTGYFGVYHKPDRVKPYLAQVRRSGKQVQLGSFATAEEAALCVARTPEGREAAERAAAALTSEEARQQAQAEELTLRVADNKMGYFGVKLNLSCKARPYQAQVRRGGKQVHLGSFATAEEAALCVARSPEGQAAAAAAALSEEEGQGKAPAMPAGAVLKEEGAVPPMPLGAYVKEEVVAPPMPPGAFFKEAGVVPPMPPDAVAKREHEVVVQEEERSDDRPKRRRSM
eukprot:scaffold123471_cov57-Phaeocystis_antarctica.AAC.2